TGDRSGEMIVLLEPGRRDARAASPYRQEPFGADQRIELAGDRDAFAEHIPDDVRILVFREAAHVGRRALDLGSGLAAPCEQQRRRCDESADGTVRMRYRTWHLSLASAG